MRNPHAESYYSRVQKLHDHRSGFPQTNKHASALDWREARTLGAERSGGQPRLKGLSNMCDGSTSRVPSSNSLAQQESKQDGVVDEGAAGIAGAPTNGLRERSSKTQYRGHNASRERRNGEHQVRDRQNHGRAQHTQTQTIQAAVVQNSVLYPIEQNFVASPSPQFCDLLEFLEKVLYRLHMSEAVASPSCCVTCHPLLRDLECIYSL